MDKIIKTGNVLLEGFFDISDGGIMIVKGQIGNDVIISDPTVQEGFIVPQIRELNIAKGVFCE